MYDSRSSHTEGPTKPKGSEGEEARIRETGVWVMEWRDEGRQGPHEAPGAVVLLKNMVSVHLKSCRLAFGTVCCVCYVRALCEKSSPHTERSIIFWASACRHSFLNPVISAHEKAANEVSDF